jgi:hypothetical protein
MCGRCGKALDATEPVFIASAWSGKVSTLYVREKYQTLTAPLCQDCAPKSMHKWVTEEEMGTPIGKTCEGCGRTVVQTWYGWSCARSEIVACSKRCRKRYHNRKQTGWRAEDYEKACVVCGAGFRAKRKDAKTCSGRCRKSSIEGCSGGAMRTSENSPYAKVRE